MPSTAAEAAIRKFIASINAHDLQGIERLCTADHVFVDSRGARLSGCASVRHAWEGYFALFADYRIEVDAVASTGDLVLISGWASAVHRGSGLTWRIPAAWRAVLAGDRIAQWQVYADNQSVYEILSRDA